MSKFSKALPLLLAIVTMADLYLGSTGSSLRLLTKPLLMPLLMLYVGIEAGTAGKPQRLILAALFFSWLGDVFLLFEADNDLYFILGLSSFLTAHIIYIIYFNGIVAETASYFRKRPVMFLAVVAFVIELLYLLWPGLGGMKVPVLVYALVIGSMLCMALWQYGRIQDKAASLFIAGAVLFVLSDAILALNRFRGEIPMGGILVMSTYVAAQFLIAQGAIRTLYANR
jgi:uncharacterized membrane protein YhhN